MLDERLAAAELGRMLDHLRDLEPAWASLTTELALLSPAGRGLLAAAKIQASEAQVMMWRHVATVWRTLDRLEQDPDWLDPRNTGVSPDRLPSVLLCARARLDASRDPEERRRLISVVERLATYSRSQTGEP